MSDFIVAPFVILGMTPFGLMLMVAEALGAAAVWRRALRRSHPWVGAQPLEVGYLAFGVGWLVSALVIPSIGENDAGLVFRGVAPVMGVIAFAIGAPLAFTVVTLVGAPLALLLVRIDRLGYGTLLASVALVLLAAAVVLCLANGSVVSGASPIAAFGLALTNVCVVALPPAAAGAVGLVAAYRRRAAARGEPETSGDGGWVLLRQLAGAGAVAVACLATVLVAGPFEPPSGAMPTLLG